MGLIAVLAVPAGAAANPDETHKRAAKAECKAERGKTSDTRKAFKSKHGSMSRCVKKTAAEEKAEEEAAQKNAAKECKAERSDPGFATGHDGKSFQDYYGTNANGKNAFGKCVSTKAREREAALDAEDAEDAEELKNAAQECAAERDDMGSGPFSQTYGTNPNDKNAFGKCVSKRARGDAGPG